VHFTRRIGGEVDCGPNAVLSLSREAYANNELNWDDLLETVGFVGFRRLAMRHFGFGIKEAYRSMSKAAFTRALQKLIPSITAEDLEPAPTGIRAQAVTPSGELVHDFLIEEAPRLLCVLNAPSPAATASLEIGRILMDRGIRQLG
jgi:L-2-hydroxyglutarate oxidase